MFTHLSVGLHGHCAIVLIIEVLEYGSTSSKTSLPSIFSLFRIFLSILACLFSHTNFLESACQVPREIILLVFLLGLW